MQIELTRQDNGTRVLYPVAHLVVWTVKSGNTYARIIGYTPEETRCLHVVETYDQIRQKLVDAGVVIL